MTRLFSTRARIARGASFAAALALLVGGIASAADRDAPATPASPPAASAASTLTASDLEAFLDGLLPVQLAHEDIAGTVVVVVKDGRVLFGKGYGYADVEKKKPVSVDDTLFRPGSISKLFTWTSVMQLVEQGKLDLDRDVNEYLDFKVPATFSKPVTLRDIMTHTPGFEEVIRDLFVGKSEDLKPGLGGYLKTHLPKRVFPPGTTPAYSNYATALAGYIVERVSGRPFDDYVEENIFRPLGMTHSTFRQPLPADLAPLMSKGYRLASDEPKPYELVAAFPAGSLAASGADMAKFMMAHLADGRLGDRQILRPETARLMHGRQRGLSDALNAMCLGFYEETRNGVRIIGHAGDTEAFHSDLHLVPSANLGFFISYNSPGRADYSTRSLVWESFLDRYFPYKTPAAAGSASAAADNRAVAGSYLSSRRSDSSFLRILYVLIETQVAVDKDGQLVVSDIKDYNGKPKKWESIAPMTYREVGGKDLLAFAKDSAGQPEMVFNFPVATGMRPKWYEDRSLLLPVAIATAVLLLLTILLWPIGAMVRRHYRRRIELPDGERRLRLWARLACLIDVLAIVVFGIIVSVGFQKITMFSAPLDPWLRLAQGLVIVGLVGTLVALVNAALAWGSGARGVWSKIGETLIALACLGFVWLALVGRLLHVGPIY